MALAENLPVFKVAYELLKDIYRIGPHLDRAYRFTLGERVQDEITGLMLNVYRANCVYDKVAFIQAARENALVVRLLVRVLHDERQVTAKSFLLINDKIESISKQLAAWEKSSAIMKTK
jgi:hypothetical protein